MTRASCAFRVWAAAFSILVSAGGCFSDPVQDTSCNPGMEGCACVELQCEEGLTCQGGSCVGLGGTGSTTAPLPSTGGSSTGAVDPSASTSSTSTTGSESSGISTAESSTSSSSVGESSSSSGGEDLCGNFVTDPQEECDGGSGCSAECTLEIHECNPLNNVPCPDGFKCSWAVLMEDPFTAYFTCMQIAAEPLGNDEGDCFVGNDAQDAQCEIGLACYRETFLDDCVSPGGCCTEYCDTTLGPEQCSSPTDACMPEPELAPGLMNLGVCR